MQENTHTSEANEIQRFELLRNKLKELESQVDRRAKCSKNEEETQVVKVQEKVNIIKKSIKRFKETTTDVMQGTQLLAIDVAAATGLLIRILTGDKLTKKENQALRRTLTDLASVVPIGFLMLLPVTAVGHAAILAAIQRYLPSLIPSTYGPERLDLLRKLIQVKETNPTTPADEP